MAEQEFDELEAGPSTEETPGDEFVWTDDTDEQGEGTLPGAQAEPVGPYETPEFRELQSRSDRRVNALTAQLASQDEELVQLKAERRKSQDRLDADKMRNWTPQQIHAHYQQRMDREAAEQAVLAEGQTLESQIGGRASGILQAVGMTRDTPGLRFVKHGSSVDWHAYADLLESVVEAQWRAGSGAERGTSPGQEAEATGEQPPGLTSQVRAQAPPATRGRVSTARGRQPVNLWASYFKALDKLAPGQPFEVVSLRKEYEKRGLDFNKMPKRRRR